MLLNYCKELPTTNLLTKKQVSRNLLFIDNSWRSSDITPTWVNLRKYNSLIQKCNQKCWILLFSCDLIFFLYFTNWMKVRKRFPPHAISFYTIGGCLFVFLNTNTKTIWSFFKREFNNFRLRLVKETKNVRFFWEETWAYD